MVQHGIAHRDLKADNLLISGADDSFPQLVISDFGCCLADGRLRLPFASWETDRGGNAALMAPEVATAVPGIFTSINYDKADLWTAGALAYQLFGLPNPFYSRKFNSRTFRNVDDLPSFPNDVPAVVGNLVRQEMLAPDPKRRMSAQMAANVCQLLLWMPSSWTGTGGGSQRKGGGGGCSMLPGVHEVLQWLLTMTTKVLYESRFCAQSSSVAQHEYQLIATFLARLNLDDVMACLHWIHDNN